MVRKKIIILKDFPLSGILNGDFGAKCLSKNRAALEITVVPAAPHPSFPAPAAHTDANVQQRECLGGGDKYKMRLPGGESTLWSSNVKVVKDF